MNISGFIKSLKEKRGGTPLTVGFSIAAFLILLVGISILFLAKSVDTLQVGQGYVFSVAWSPDGRLLASGSENGEVSIWDTREWNLLKTFQGHESSVTSIAWNPAGNRLASVGLDDKVRIWDLTTDEEVLVFTTYPNGASTEIIWSSNEDRLANLGWFRDGKIQIWDISTSAQISIFPSANGMITWSPDGSKLALSNPDGGVSIWDVSNPENIQFPSEQQYPSAWSLDGRLLASVDQFNTIHIWDSTGSQLLGSLYGHKMPVTGLAWSQDATKLASSSDENIIRIWDTVLMQPFLTLRVQSRMAIRSNRRDELMWSPNGTQLAAVGGLGVYETESAGLTSVVWVWDALTGQILNMIDNRVSISSIAWNPDGSILAISGADGIRMWNSTRP